jgi:hypothetical protein
MPKQIHAMLRNKPAAYLLQNTRLNAKRNTEMKELHDDTHQACRESFTPYPLKSEM